MGDWLGGDDAPRQRNTDGSAQKCVQPATPDPDSKLRVTEQTICVCLYAA